MDAICKEFNIERETSAAYTAHVNGLVENENKLLISILSKLCANGTPGVVANIGLAWPTHFSKAVSMLNERITPVLGMSTKAVLFGIVDTVDIDDLIDLDPDVGLRFAFLEAERDVTIETLRGVQDRRKQYFDRKAHPVDFEPGDLVLVHNSRLDNSKEVRYKLLAPWFGPWFGPFVVVSRIQNSYLVKTLAGDIVNGKVHGRRMKRFFLGDGVQVSELESSQQEEGESPLSALEGVLSAMDGPGEEDGTHRSEERETIAKSRPQSAAVTRHAFIAPR
jgi:hypothetical protein